VEESLKTEPTVSVRTWTQATRDACRFGEVRQIMLAYVRPDSGMSRDEALDRIMRIVDLAEPPTHFEGVRVLGGRDLKKSSTE
jgi:hypothetical protein